MQSGIRRMQILEIMQRKRRAEIKELAEEFEVTTMTIRRDLALFEKQGLVTIIHGGAFLNQWASHEASFIAKTTETKDGKKKIAELAAKEVQNGDIIILDCGTTNFELAKCLEDKSLTVITNSLPAITFLKDCRKIRLISAPGQYNDVSAGFSGMLTAEFYHNVHADKVFMSASHFDLETGAMSADVDDGSLKRAIMKAAKKKILLADHTKFNTQGLVSFASAADFDLLVTDEKPEESNLIGLTKAEVTVVYQ